MAANADAVCDLASRFAYSYPSSVRMGVDVSYLTLSDEGELNEQTHNFNVNELGSLSV